MTPEFAIKYRSFMVEQFRLEEPPTRALLEAFPEEAFGFRPHPSAPAAGELAWAMVGRQVQMLEECREGRGFAEGPRFSEAPTAFWALVDWYPSRLAVALDRLAHAELRVLLERVAFGGVSQPNVQVLAAIDRHLAFHRGQLTAYLGLLGIPTSPGLP